MPTNASLSGTFPPTTCPLDKNIVRAVFEARVRVRRGRIPLPHQAQAAMVYQALRQAGLITYVTPETVHSAQRRDPLITASLLTPLTTLTPGRYLRRWGFVFAIARTWKTVDGKALKDLVTHVPRTYFQRIRVPRLPGAQGCKTFWIFRKCLCLRHIGDVTVVLSKPGHSLGPKPTKILVTNLDEWTPRQYDTIGSDGDQVTYRCPGAQRHRDAFEFHKKTSRATIVRKQ